MNALLVEDDDFKRFQITEFLEAQYPLITVIAARSLQGANRALQADGFALIILDMSLPTFDITSSEHGGRPRPLGGTELLDEVDRRELGVPVIVLTQFPRFEAAGESDEDLDLAELDRRLEREYSRNYRGAVFFDAAGGWRRDLARAIDAAMAGLI
jgi:CheY-like chemotaxis protein